MAGTADERWSAAIEASVARTVVAVRAQARLDTIAEIRALGCPHGCGSHLPLCPFYRRLDTLPVRPPA